MVKFKYYKTAATYGTAGDSIAKDDIVFIEETNTLHTHEHDYVFGNAYTDMWLKQAALGSTTKPVYLSAKGVFSEASTYAGGTAVTLNTTSKAASTASFYAPTSAGTSGQIIKFPASGSTPIWSSDYVASVGGKSGAITLDTTTTTAKAVKFAIDSNGKITGSVQGLGTAATTDASAYATSTQGATADSALQGVSIAGTSLTKSSNSISAATLKSNLGLGSAAYTASTDYATAAQGTKADNAMPKSGGTFTGAVTLNADPSSNLHAATKQYVDNQITSKIAAADAMVFKGTLGTGGNVTALPTSGVVVGDTYKVITAGTYANQVAKIGDLFIATASTPTWAYVPSGDEVVTTVKTGTSNLSATAQSGELVVGTAATKAFETTLTDGGNLPTGAAVKAFVEGKGYLTSVGNKALKIASGSGTATQAITMNESSADKTLTITGDGTYITGAVSGSAGAPTVTLSHAGPGTGSALTTSNGTAGSYALNTEYTVLTGVTVSADAKGHITGISTTRQKIKDTNTTYTFDGTYNASTNKAATVSTVTTAVTNGLTWSEYN